MQRDVSLLEAGVNWTSVETMIAVLLFVLLSFASPRAAAQSNSADSDSSAIKQAVADFTDAYNRHDVRACGSHLADDIDFISVQGISTHGREAVQDRWPALFTGRLKNAHRTVSVRSIRFLTPEIAVVNSDWQLTNSRLTDGGPVISLRKGLYDWVMTKQKGRWLIAVFHESDVPLTSAK